MALGPGWLIGAKTTAASARRPSRPKIGAETWEKKKKARKRRMACLGIRTKAEETTVAEWIKQWWKVLADDFTLHTQRGYAGAINRYLAPELGRVRNEPTYPRAESPKCATNWSVLGCGAKWD